MLSIHVVLSDYGAMSFGIVIMLKEGIINKYFIQKAILLIEIYIQYTICQCISENTNTIMILTAEHDNLYAMQ